MKFGRSLPRNQVPEWATFYINYKGLKKLIKTATEDPTQIGEPDLAGFFHYLDRNLEDVDHFYNKKLQDFTRRLKILEDRYEATKEASRELQADDREDLLTALLELRGQLRKLQWYGEVNRRGFIKITKKLDKKTKKVNAQKKYLALKVDPAPFATNEDLFSALNKLNDWISLLGEAAALSSTETALSPATLPLKHSTSHQSLRIPTESYAIIVEQIHRDQADQLSETLAEIRKSLPDVTENSFQQFWKGLLQRAISARSRQCTTALLQQIVFLDDKEDINRRNCIHRLVASIGRAHSSVQTKAINELRPDAEAELYNFITPAAAPSNPFKAVVAQEEHQKSILTRADERIAFLQFLLDNLQLTQRSALMSKDILGRTPLHYAAEYGVCVMCEVIIEHLQRWKLFNVKNGIDGPEWQDSEGWAPLHLSVIGGHPLTTQALLDSEKWTNTAPSRGQVQRRPQKSSAVLAIATKSNFIEVVRILVEARVDINYQDDQGETALHVAARFGHADCARLLLAGNSTQRADTELTENTYGWTPLFIACVDGHLPIVELLIDAEADLERTDTSGWTAKEHAALRGHIAIAERLAEVTPEPDLESDAPSSTASSPPASTSLADRTSNGISSSAMKASDHVKSFGHRYLTDKSMILVSLGTMNMRDPKPPITLDHIPLNNAHSTQLDTALSIVVSAKGAEGEPEIIDLPVQDNISTEPIVFYTKDLTKVKLLFDLVPTYAGNHERIVGRAVAMLSSVKASLGSKKMQLQGDVVVPIMAAADLEIIGSLTFNFLVITPFEHPNMTITEDQTYWKSMASTSTMVIGHRGLGKNVAGRQSLQLGENTIESFIAAANLGASYVEFDIQITKDHVPVIYHDFLVSETGIDAPVHTLTLEQFLHVSSPRHSRAVSPARQPIGKSPNSSSGDPRLQPRQRSMSLGGANGDSTEMDERMKHTRDFKKKGFKGNSRGNHIQAPFATLEEMFKKLPPGVGFNMEMKYPMLSESEDEEMDQYAFEINNFVDTVLTKVYDLGKGRNMIFSSFNPDICLLLNLKQPSIPVLFLTDAGTCDMGDIRATSLQEAVRFASRWNLLGVVSTAVPFVLAPRLVRVVKESGLVCVSYGMQNNDNDKVRLQVKQGIDAVIVDNVLAIRRGLTGGSTGKKPEGTVKELNNIAMNGHPDRSTDSLQVPPNAVANGSHSPGISGAHNSNLTQAVKILQAV